MINSTPHPKWVQEFLDSIKTDQERIINHPFFLEIDRGQLTVKQFRGALINFYPLVYSFPQFMALTLAKVPSGGSKASRQARRWLIKNISQEERHSSWWCHFAIGFGISRHDLNCLVSPPPAMDAINNYLWRICTYGSLAESISAANFAIEGPTGVWTKNLRDGISRYDGVEGVRADEKTMQWVTAHAEYDDRHPVEALEIVKTFATSEDEQTKASRAAKRALEYYAMALDACYEQYR